MILKSKISGIAYTRKAYVYSMPSFDQKEFPKIWVLFWYDRKSYWRAGRRMRNWPLAVALSSANCLLGKKKNLKEVDDAEKDRVDDVPEETNSAGLSQSRRVRLHGWEK